jgi:hypothetical protein
MSILLMELMVLHFEEDLQLHLDLIFVELEVLFDDYYLINEIAY